MGFVLLVMHVYYMVPLAASRQVSSGILYFLKAFKCGRSTEICVCLLMYTYIKGLYPLPSFKSCS